MSINLNLLRADLNSTQLSLKHIQTPHSPFPVFQSDQDALQILSAQYKQLADSLISIYSEVLRQQEASVLFTQKTEISGLIKDNQILRKLIDQASLSTSANELYIRCQHLESEIETKQAGDQASTLIIGIFNTDDPFKADQIWRAKNYSQMKELTDADNFTLLRELTLARDACSLTPEQQFALINQLREVQLQNDSLRHSISPKTKKQANQTARAAKIRDLEQQVYDKEQDINQLITQCRDLQVCLKDSKRGYSRLEEEMLVLRRQLSQKTREFKAALQPSPDPAPVQDENLIQALAEANQNIEFLKAKIVALEAPEQSLESCLTTLHFELRLRVEELQQQIIRLKLENDLLLAESSKSQLLLQEQKRSNADLAKAANEPAYNHWKKLKRDHVQRVERAHLQNIDSLRDHINKLTESLQLAHEDISRIESKYFTEVASITSKLKKEHDSKVVLAEHLKKEKERTATVVSGIKEQLRTHELKYRKTIQDNEDQLARIREDFQRVSSENSALFESLAKKEQTLESLSNNVQHSFESPCQCRELKQRIQAFQSSLEDKERQILRLSQQQENMGILRDQQSTVAFKQENHLLLEEIKQLKTKKLESEGVFKKELREKQEQISKFEQQITELMNAGSGSRFMELQKDREIQRLEASTRSSYETIQSINKKIETLENQYMDAIRAQDFQLQNVKARFAKWTNGQSRIRDPSNLLEYFDVMMAEANHAELIKRACEFIVNRSSEYSTDIAYDNVRLHRALLHKETEDQRSLAYLNKKQAKKWALTKLEESEREKSELRQALADRNEDMIKRLEKAHKTIEGLQQINSNLKDQKEILMKQLKETPWKKPIPKPDHKKNTQKTGEEKKTIEDLRVRLAETEQRCYDQGFHDGKAEIRGENEYLQSLLEEYRAGKDELQEQLLNVQARPQASLYEEEIRVRQSLEAELVSKCDLIETLYKDLEYKRGIIREQVLLRKDALIYEKSVEMGRVKTNHYQNI